MKVAIFADIHINKDDDDPRRLYDKLDIIKFIKKYCVHNHIDTIIFVGDWWTNRKHLDIEVINVGYTAAEIMADNATVYALVGNHDFYYKNITDIHSLIPFKHIDKFHIISEPSTLCLGELSIMMIPYLSPIQFNETIKSISNVDVLMVHQTFNGFMANNGFIMDDSISTDAVKQFKLVISGDIHKHQTINNITYVGAPLPQDFNDLGDDFGFMVLDTDTITLDRVLIPSRRYHKINSSSIDYSLIKDNIIDVMFDGNTMWTDSDIVRVLDDINKHKPFKLTYQFSDRNIDIAVDGVRNEIESVSFNNVVSDYVKVHKFENMDQRLILKTLSDVIEYCD